VTASWPFAAIAFLFGLVVGSFVNVVVHRVPRGVSVVTPRSRCPRCGSPIRALDNLPVLSFLLRGGRCRDCRGRISWTYPLIELSCGLLFVASLARFTALGPALAAAIFGSLLIALAAIDTRHLVLPDGLTFPGMAAGVGFALAGWLPTATLAESIAGLLGGAGALFLLAEAWYALRGEDGMGLGDAKMLGAIGAFLGWKGAAIAFVVAVVLGGAIGAALLLLRLRGPKARLPFGVFLAAGGLAALFLGTGPADRYLDLVVP
jgi:leader peptidase (prepilin peptidase)/N-methyltransferase